MAKQLYRWQYEYMWDFTNNEYYAKTKYPISWVFCSRNLRVASARAVGDRQHLKLGLQAGRNSYDAIAFKQGYWLQQLPERIDIAYTFEMNSYMGRNTLQLNVKDIQPTREQGFGGDEE